MLSGAFDTLSHVMETHLGASDEDNVSDDVALADFIKECGLPTRLGQLKSTVEITPEVLRKVADICNIIKCGPRKLSRDEIYDILMECL